MAAPSFREMTQGILVALTTVWRPCQPLLTVAAAIALAIAAVFGLFAPGEVGQSLAGLPLTVVTLAVSAGVAGYLVSGDSRFTTLDGVCKDPRSYRFVLRYLLLSVGLSVPLFAMIPVLGGAAGGDGVGAPALLVALALVSLIVFLAARLAIFPYSAFLPRPTTLGDAWRMTEGHALKIIGVVALFAVAILGSITVATYVLGGVLEGLGSATGGGGQAAAMAVQALGQLVAVYAIDCVYGTVTRLLAKPGPTAPPPA